MTPLEIPMITLAILTLLAVRGGSWAGRLASATGLHANLPEAAGDGLLELPSPDHKRPYSEKASSAEMHFAEKSLHFAGLLLLTLGMLSYLKVSGVTEKATSGGFLQCGLGLLLGLFLSWAGDRLHRRGQSAYAQPLLASGIVIITVSAGVAHFTFGWLPGAAFFVANFLIFSWAGLAAVRYDSPFLGGCLLVAMLLGPVLMSFPLGQLSAMLAYQLTLNLAVTVVAYRQRWDGFLIASLAGSYALFFAEFGLSAPWAAMAFLGMTYALFLVSGNLFHFLRRSASDFHLSLSMVNPLLFGCVSYVVLLRLPNEVALAIYAAIAALHAGLAWMATRMRGQGEAYQNMAQANVSLALLFSTAAVSFLAHITDDTTYFALVTGLWVALGIGWLELSRRLPRHLAEVVRRGSYGAMGLACVQLVYVVPTMAQPHLLELGGMLALLAYFFRHERTDATREERLFSNLVVLGALVAGRHAFPLSALSLPGLLLSATLPPLALLAYRRYPLTLVGYRYLAPGLGCVCALMMLSHPWSWHLESLALPLVALLLGSLSPLCRGREELDEQRPVGLLLATVVLLRGTLAAGLAPATSAAAASLVLLLLLAATSWEARLERPLQALGLLLGWACLFLPCSLSAASLGLLLVPAVYALGALLALREQRWQTGFGAAMLAGLLVMKLALLPQTGAGGTLLWCLLGLFLLTLRQELAQQLALGVMFLAFLKSILFDANFQLGKGGLAIAPTPGVWGMVLVMATIVCFAGAARLKRETPEVRNYYTLFGLLIFAFHTTFKMFSLYGDVDEFQVVLSGFWAACALLFVAYGIHRENKLFRLFGLVVLVGCVAKIYAVDIWVLDAYNQTTTTLVLGSLLMAVSYLYQNNRERLVPAC